MKPRRSVAIRFASDQSKTDAVRRLCATASMRKPPARRELSCRALRFTAFCHAGAVWPRARASCKRAQSGEWSRLAIRSTAR